MEGGSLYDYIRSTNNRANSTILIDWQKDFNFIKDIINGMNYLHNKKILHLDLKTLNILLNAEKTQAKISDFGLARINTITSSMSTSHSIQTGKAAKGTIRYMSPEVSKGQPGSYESDVWSFGCVLLEFATRELPFYTLQDAAVFPLLQNDNAEVPINLNTKTPRIISVLIYKCLSRNKAYRPSFGEIIDAVKNVNGDKLKETLITQEVKGASNAVETIKTRSNLRTLLEKQQENEAAKRLDKELSDLQQRFRQVYLDLYNAQQNQINSTISYVQPTTYTTWVSSTPRSSYGGVYTGSSYVSNGSANGRALYQGPRGGTYYVTRTGRKRYV